MSQSTRSIAPAHRARNTNFSPPPTSFIGRQRELAELDALIARAAGEAAGPLVTIFGPPGTGKTRLALRYVEHQLSAGAVHGGAWIADLTAASDAAGICAALARALGVPLTASTSTADSVTRLGHALSAIDAPLIVLDNFEQIVEAGPRTVGAWRAAAPHARFVVTSRELLRLPGEQVLELSPLPVPPPGAITASELTASDAARLLLARATGYRVSDADAPAVAELLRALDGIPLAVELAATRLRVLPPAQLVARLPARLDLLTAAPRATAARQATLRGAIDWSWQLLEPAEQHALAQCAVFRGGLSLELAESVIDLSAVAAPPPILDVVQALRDKSLLRSFEPAALPGELRFGLYQSIREYAVEQLDRLGAAGATADRHARAFAAWGSEVASRVNGPAGVGALRRLAVDGDNLDAAFSHAVATPALARCAVDLALALDPLLAAHGSAAAHVDLLDRAVTAADHMVDPDAAELRARLLAARGRARRGGGRAAAALADFAAALALLPDTGVVRGEVLCDLGEAQQALGRVDDARGSFERAIAVIGDGDTDRRARCRVLASLGSLRHAQGALDEAQAYYRRALAGFRDLGDRRSEGGVLEDLGTLRLQQGRLAEASSLYEEARALLRVDGDRRTAGIIAGNLGVLAQEQGDVDGALRWYRRSLAAFRRVGDRLLEGHLRGYLAGLRLESGEVERAQRGYDTALAIAREVGDRRYAGLFAAALGACAAVRDQPEVAAESFTTAAALLEDVGDPGLLGALEIHRGHLELARARAATAAGDAAAAAAHRDAALALLTEPEVAGALADRSDDARFAHRILARAIAGDALVVGPEHSWFQAPGAEPARIDDRVNLRRLLSALIDRAPAPLTTDELFAAGWPDEQVLPEAGLNRVKVALTTLRRMGLRDVLLRTDGGYVLDPATPVVQVATPFERAAEYRPLSPPARDSQ